MNPNTEISDKVPVFVVAGHPNEGKSSVLSTLAEDDSVRISPVPGETRECRVFPVVIDGREVIHLVDTPGFQNPLRTLRWMQSYQGPDSEMLPSFIRAHRDDPTFRDDCELLSPMVDASGIIFVVDGSRPVRRTDRAEMEILRLIGRPRLSVINCKSNETAWLPQWQQEFRKHFNSVRVFNSCRATYTGRLELLESLKAIDHDLSSVLNGVIHTIEQDWKRRREHSVEIMTAMLQDIIAYRREAEVASDSIDPALRDRLFQEYRSYAKSMEARAHEKIRALYRHNIYNCRLPEPSLLHQDLFSRETWEFLGLSKAQLVIAGALGGAAAGAAVDLGHGGLSMGLFTAAGGVLGAAGTALKARDILSGRRLLGFRLDRHRLIVGPASNIQLLYVLLDRALIYYRHIITWAHGRRDYENAPVPLEDETAGVTVTWDKEQRKICENFFNCVRQGHTKELDRAEMALRDMLSECLESMTS